jgi:uridine monophosphate synthetase
MGLLIAVSRGIARAANPRAAAQQIVQSIRREWLTLPVRPVPASPVPADLTASLAEGLLAAGCVQFGQFTLKSGLQSPIYIDLRRLIAYPGLLGDVAEAYAAILQNLAFDRLAAVPYAALPIATAISLQTGWPMLYPRKESKSYGTQAEIEGVFMAGERVVVIDDLATTGGSKFEAIQKLSKAGLVVEDVVVLIDRQSGAREALTRAGFRMHAVVTLTELLDHWERAERVPCEQINATRAFLAGYQEPLPEGTRFPLPLEMTPDFALTSS